VCDVPRRHALNCTRLVVGRSEPGGSTAIVLNYEETLVTMLTRNVWLRAWVTVLLLFGAPFYPA
jgi:hypothetical protein